MQQRKLSLALLSTIIAILAGLLAMPQLARSFQTEPLALPNQPDMPRTAWIIPTHGISLDELAMSLPNSAVEIRVEEGIKAIQIQADERALHRLLDHRGVGQILQERPELSLAVAEEIQSAAVQLTDQRSHHANQDEIGTIQGTVINSDGEPISDVRVEVYKDRRRIGSAYTDAQGIYTIPDLTVGTYQVYFDVASDTNYLSLYYNGTLDGTDSLETASAIAVTQGQTTSLNVTLPQGGIIQGTVTNSNGEPIPDVWITAYLNQLEAKSVQANEQGIYTFLGLRTDNYQFLFSPGSSSNHPSIYYDGTLNGADSLETASAIAVTQGQTTTLDVTLPSGGILQGTVTNSNGEPIPNVWVEVYQNQNKIRSAHTTNAQGIYTILALRSGSYQLYFGADSETNYLSLYYNGTLNGSDSLEAASAIAVTQEQTTTLNVTLPNGGILQGTVTNSKGEPIPNVWMEIYQDNSRVRAIYTNEQGVYTVLGLRTGDYQLYLLPNTNSNYLPVYYNGTLNGADSLETASAITINHGETTTLDVTLPDGGILSGQVLDNNGQPIANGRISLYQEKSGSIAAIDTKYLNGDNHYEIQRIPTGTYILAAFADGGNLLDTYSGNVGNAYAATRINIEAGKSHTENITMLPGGIITGRVTDKAGNPLAGIDISASSIGCGPGYAFTRSDANGVYQLVGLPTATYNLYIGSGLYVEMHQNSISVNVAQITENIDATLELGGVITGKVTDANGNPVENAYVQLYKPEDGDFSYAGSTETDSSGIYTATGLVTSNYHVLVEDDQYIRQVYGGGFWEDEGTAIPVALGQTTSNINVTLQVGQQISGTVTGTNEGSVLISAAAYRYDPNRQQWREAGYDSASYQGVYSVKGLPAGTYRLYFRGKIGYTSKWYGDAEDVEQATEIVITEGAGAEINEQLTMFPYGNISGRVIGPTHETCVYIDVFKHLANQWDYVDDYIDVDDLGNWELEGVPVDTYRVRMAASNYATVFYNNKPNIESADNVIIEEGKTTKDINFTLVPAVPQQPIPTPIPPLGGHKLYLPAVTK